VRGDAGGRKGDKRHDGGKCGPAEDEEFSGDYNNTSRGQRQMGKGEVRGIHFD